jgi:hypothetical protein
LSGRIGTGKALAYTEPLFCHHTTIIGNVVDCYKLADHHNFINHQIPDKENKVMMTRVVGFLAYQLISNVSSLLSFYNPIPQKIRSPQLTAAPACSYLFS